jgi:hypothetical protein
LRVLVQLRLPLATLLAFCATPFTAPRLVAQDPFEMEVYTPRTAGPGELELELHSNYVADGSTAFDGALAPTDRQARFSLELTRGITHSWELALYGLAATRPGAGAELAGWRVRSRVRAPEGWRLPVQLGINLEVEHTLPAFAERENAVELVPVIGWSRGPVAFAINAPFEHALGNGAIPGWEFEPSARVDLGVSRTLTLTTEYFTSLGELGRLDAPQAQRHLLFPGVAMHFGDDVTWNAAVGFGLTDATDRLVLKTGIEFPLRE